MNFYDEIRQHIAEETNDNKKYMQLAESAPTERAKKILTDIAHEEERHKEYLQEILGNLKSSEPQTVPAQNDRSGGRYASGEINNQNLATIPGMTPPLR